MKKEISFIGLFNDSKTEGLMKISALLYKSLSKSLKNKLIFSYQNLSSPLVHIHTAGFTYAMKKYSGKTIYSLYTNPRVGMLDSLHDIFSYFRYCNCNLNTFIRLIFALISAFIPLWLKRIFLKKMGVVIVPTHYIESTLNLNNTKVIPFGIDTKRFRPASKQKTSKSLTVGYIGSSSTLKGITDFGKAVKVFDTRVKKVAYTSTSDARLKKYLHKNGVLTRGIVKDIAEAYHDIDILVLPYRGLSSSIGIPLVLLEAMASGKAIITTDLPHLREVGGDGSVLYVRSYDTKGLRKAISRLVKDEKLRKTLEEKARRRAVEFYDQKLMLNSYKELYEDLL
jgi:glycosyltransferase involved in cell wall biosynthesis